MTIVQAGSTNLAAVQVPNVLVQIIPPNPLLNGVPTNIIGVVGTATYGPVNAPTIVGSMAEYVQMFGNPQNALYDMGTQVYTASLQGANNFRCVRVTDGTDEEADAAILDSASATGATLFAKYTGTLGNTINAILSNGSSPSTYRITIYFSGGTPEVFDNIGGSGTQFWTNLVNAINLGQNSIRGPSQIVTATASISSVTVTAAGNYASIPAISATIGSGAVFVPTMKVVAANIATAGTGYVPADTVTFSGGTASQQAIATVATTQLVSSVVNAPGSGYAIGDTITLAGGTAVTPAVLTVTHAQLESVTLNNPGTGYAVNDTITLAGGTAGVAAVITVNTESGGVIETFTITTKGDYTVETASFTQASTSGGGTGATFNAALFGVLTTTVSNAGSYSANTANFTQASTSGTGTGATFHTTVFGIHSVTIGTAGSYTVLPADPVSQGSTSGSGTGATFNVAGAAGWGVNTITVSSDGVGYTTNSQIVFTGGGGTGGAAATFLLGTANLPSLQSYVLSGGTNGNAGVDDMKLIGTDGLVRTGMYSLRRSGASIGIIADQTVAPTYWGLQAAFGAQEGMYMIAAMAAGYQENIMGAINVKTSAAVQNYELKVMMGDWIYLADPFNNVTRLVSSPGYVAGILATQLPSGSSLNKIMVGISATQKSADNTIYSDADLLALETAGIDVVTNNIPANPAAGVFGVRLGVNTSGTITTNGDNYSRMINFLAETFNTGLGNFIGLPQTTTVQNQARATLQDFLQNLEFLGLIGSVNGNLAFRVILDSSNNPPNRVAAGYMQADVQVTLFSIIQNFVVNLQAGQSVQITTLPPQIAA